MILIPLMKCVRVLHELFFDTRHLVIAVNPRHIERCMNHCSSAACRRNVIENYDFVNGAGRWRHAGSRARPDIMRKAYGEKAPNRTTYSSLAKPSCPTSRFQPPCFTTNDPVDDLRIDRLLLQPEDACFANLSDRKKPCT